MEKQKHTPGPWTVSVPWAGYSSVFGRDGQLVFGLAAGGKDEAQPAEVCEANARLIAAAPDLLEACKLALGAFEHAHAIDWSILEAAIAKAEVSQ